MYKDTRMAFVLLWILLEEDRLQKRGLRFTDWNIPCLGLEIDHSGRFRLLPTGEVYYEGGETKSAPTGRRTHFAVNISCSRCAFATRKNETGRCRITHWIWQERGVFRQNLCPSVATTQSTKLERYRVKFTRTDIPEHIPFLGTDIHQVISMEGDRVFSPGHPQIYTEYDTILLRLETPMTTQ